MYRVSTVLAGILFTASISPAQSVTPQEFVLDNGLKVVMVEDHTVPSVCFSIAFRVGSRNEKAGITGISHLFEHMMFNGSEKYAPTEFDRILEAGGGYSNAYTSNDITFYYDEFNSDLLGKVVHMEADRMRSLKIDTANLEQERGIVKEERRVSTDNSVAGAMYEELYASAFMAHPYQNPVVGWMSDLNNITLQDARDYFRTYYAPNNATIFVVGDFNAAALKESIAREFGPIPSQEKPRAVVDSEPPQRGEKRISLHRDAQLPAVMIGFKSASASSSDIHALSLLSTILSGGQSSRLYKRLVYDLQIVTDVESGVDEYIDPGLFYFYAQMQPGYETALAEKELYAIVDSIGLNGVSEQELQKAKNAAQMAYIDEFKTNAGIASRMGYYEVIWGDYRKAFEVLQHYAKVTREDIRNAAAKYLAEHRRSVVTLVPEQSMAETEGIGE